MKRCLLLDRITCEFGICLTEHLIYAQVATLQLYQVSEFIKD